MGDVGVLLAAQRQRQLERSPGVLERGPQLPADAVAAVNGRAIGAGAFTSQLEAVAAQLKRAPDASERGAGGFGSTGTH